VDSSRLGRRTIPFHGVEDGFMGIAKGVGRHHRSPCFEFWNGK
jgi:hypothetical protein